DAPPAVSASLNFFCAPAKSPFANSCCPSLMAAPHDGTSSAGPVGMPDVVDAGVALALETTSGVKTCTRSCFVHTQPTAARPVTRSAPDKTHLAISSPRFGGVKRGAAVGGSSFALAFGRRGGGALTALSVAGSDVGGVISTGGRLVRIVESSAPA